jgi:hypothetical protein
MRPSEGLTLHTSIVLCSDKTKYEPLGLDGLLTKP